MSDEGRTGQNTKHILRHLKCQHLRRGWGQRTERGPEGRGREELRGGWAGQTRFTKKKKKKMAQRVGQELEGEEVLQTM